VGEGETLSNKNSLQIKTTRGGKIKIIGEGQRGKQLTKAM